MTKLEIGDKVITDSGIYIVNRIVDDEWFTENHSGGYGFLVSGTLHLIQKGDWAHIPAKVTRVIEDLEELLK